MHEQLGYHDKMNAEDMSLLKEVVVNDMICGEGEGRKRYKYIRIGYAKIQGIP